MIKQLHSVDKLMRICGLIATVIGLYWLVLWLTGYAAQRSPEGFITMKTNMALGLALGGISLLLLNPASKTQRKAILLFLAIFILLIGGLTFIEHLFNYNLHIDQLLAAEPPGAMATTAPNRMGPIGSSSLFFVSLGLLSSIFGRHRWTPYFGLIVCFINMVPLIGFIYDISDFYSIPKLTAVAFPSVIALLSLGLGLFLAERKSGLIFTLFRANTGGMLLRRFLPFIFLIPLALGFLAIHFERAGYANSIGILVVLIIVTFATFSWISAAKLSQATDVYRAIGESLNFGIWTCDEKGRNTYASESFLKLLGITQEQCSNFNWTTVLHPDDIEKTQTAWMESVQTGLPWEREHRFLGKDSKYHPILARGVPIRNARGQITQWVGINLDIAKLKKTEEDLRAAIATRDEFLSIASHELRTPLTALYMQLELIGRLLTNETPDYPSVLSRHAAVMKSSHQLVRLLENMMDNTLVSTGNFSIEKKQLDLKIATIECISLISEEAGRKGSHLTLKADQAVMGFWDVTKIRQIILNLLSNAVKYGEGKPIVVSLSSDSKNAKLLVQDHGKGVPREMQGKIFERFARVETRNAVTGMGLGLYIVRKLVEAHRGSISVTSEAGEGALFTLVLPLQ